MPELSDRVGEITEASKGGQINGKQRQKERKEAQAGQGEERGSEKEIEFKFYYGLP